MRSSASALRLDVRAAEDIVLEAPVEPEPRWRVHRKPTDHEGKEAERDRGVLALFALFHGIKGAQ